MLEDELCSLLSIGTHGLLPVQTDCYREKKVISTEASQEKLLSYSTS